MGVSDLEVSCPHCGQRFAVDYVTGGSNPTDPRVAARCPLCSVPVMLELPSTAVLFAARPLGAPSLVEHIAVRSA